MSYLTLSNLIVGCMVLHEKVEVVSDWPALIGQTAQTAMGIKGSEDHLSIGLLAKSEKCCLRWDESLEWFGCFDWGHQALQTRLWLGRWADGADCNGGSKDHLLKMRVWLLCKPSLTNGNGWFGCIQNIRESYMASRVIRWFVGCIRSEDDLEKCARGQRSEEEAEVHLTEQQQQWCMILLHFLRTPGRTFWILYQPTFVILWLPTFLDSWLPTFLPIERVTIADIWIASLWPTATWEEIQILCKPHSLMSGTVSLLLVVF